MVKQVSCQAPSLPLSLSAFLLRTFSIYPQDSRRSIKRHKHDRDPPVARLVQVTRRLDPATREIHVPELSDHDVLVVVGVLCGVGRGRGGRCGRRKDLPRNRLGFLEHTEERSSSIRHSLGRDVDVPRTTERRGPDAEDLLLEEPCYQ